MLRLTKWGTDAVPSIASLGHYSPRSKEFDLYSRLHATGWECRESPLYLTSFFH